MAEDSAVEFPRFRRHFELFGLSWVLVSSKPETRPQRTPSSAESSAPKLRSERRDPCPRWRFRAPLRTDGCVARWKSISSGEYRELRWRGWGLNFFSHCFCLRGCCQYRNLKNWMKNRMSMKNRMNSRNNSRKTPLKTPMNLTSFPIPQ